MGWATRPCRQSVPLELEQKKMHLFDRSARVERVEYCITTAPCERACAGLPATTGPPLLAATTGRCPPLLLPLL